MKQIPSLLLAAALSATVFSSCGSYENFSRTATGMSMGGVLGSTVGGLVGGYRGSSTGMLLGTAVGALACNMSGRASQTTPQQSYSNHDVTAASYQRNQPAPNYQYGNGYVNNAPTVGAPAGFGTTSGLQISNVVFNDANGNLSLQPGERAYITFDVTNVSNEVIYNIFPVVQPNNKRVKASKMANMGNLAPGQTLRYQASVVAQTNAKKGEVVFSLGFLGRSDYFRPTYEFAVPLIK